MTQINKILMESTALLEKAGIGTARLDVLVLLEDVINKDRPFILANPNFEINDKEAAKLKKLLKKRAEHIPVAYLLGHKEFYGYNFVISPHVLVPRPESETMIDELKIIAKFFTQPKIADIGTGSGALGITAKLELKSAHVCLSDIDEECLKNAKINVDFFTLPIEVIKSDLLSSLDRQADILLCNLPYVPDDFEINTAATHEPKHAIFGGKDGLDLYRKLFKQAKNGHNEVLYILCESLPRQHQALAEIATKNNFKLIKENDFVQVFKRVKI